MQHMHRVGHVLHSVLYEHRRALALTGRLARQSLQRYERHHPGMVEQH